MNDDIVKAFLADPHNGRMVLSASFANFIRFFHWYMYRSQFIFKPFHVKIIRKLEDIAFGRAEKRNLMINLPPRMGKSSIMKYFCAWSYMLNPHSNNIYTSYSDDLANAFSKDIRAIIESDAFKTFTGVYLNKGKTGADYWETNLGGGFRAAPMGGAITGFGCFSYGTKVVTDTGIRSIGEVVSRREPVKFKTWNGKVEWKEPIKYIRNDVSEFMRIVMSDGSVIDCTPDHRFYTQDGIKRADELTTSSVFPSNPLDSISTYSKFKNYIRNRVVFVADKLSLFFCGKILVNRGSFYPDAKPLRFSTPVDSTFNVGDIPVAESVIRRNFFVATRVLGYLPSYFWRNFAIPVVRSVSDGISFVVRLGSVGKVFHRVVKSVAIKMSCNKPLRSLTDKCFGNKLMDGSVSVSNTNKKVSLLVFPRLKDSSGLVEVASDSTNRGNLVDSLIFSDRKPVFIYRIGHFPSYCVTIPVNHNFFLQERQEILVGNSGVTGDEFGGCTLIDDPNKASSVKSQAELQNTIDYYLNTLKSRLNNQGKTPTILIMQRLSLEDLAGYILENEADDWDVVKLQGLDEDTGIALWEEKFPAKELLKLKNQAPFVYYGQYQQEPIVVGGSVIKTEWFKFYSDKEEYDYQSTWFTSDTAQKKGEGNDFSVMCFWGKTTDNRLHLIDMVRGKYDAGELKEQVLLFWNKWRGFRTVPYGFYIEDKSSGIGVIQELKKSYPIPIIPVGRSRHKDDRGMWVSMDKFSRCMTSIPYIANGWVYLPNSESDDISSVLLAETSAFKADLSHKHDDICDNLFDAIDVAFGTTGISSIFI